MSYIISTTNPLVNSKLTAKGREKLAKGQLNFKYFAIGDSEINYGFEEIRDANPGDAVLNGKSIFYKPKDVQSNIKYFVSKDANVSPLTSLSESEIKALKAQIVNRAPERGFFDVTSKDTLTTTPFVVSNGTVQSDNFNGNSSILITGGDLTVGNYILFKLTNEYLGALTANSNTEPTQHLWYKIESKSGDTYTLDRALPLLANTATPIQYYEYASGNIYENGMANSSVTPYWDANTLSFDANNNISTDDVPFWNMNNIWSENIIGLDTSTAEEFYKYGSNDMLGIRSPFLCYLDTISSSEIQLEDVCVDTSATTQGNTVDGDNRAISVIHYTNNEISNLYGEYLYVDATKDLEVEIPTMMYHRRKFVGGTGTGDVMGMTFVADASTKHKIKNSDIEYYDLIEHPDMVNGTPKVVGKVLHNHHTIIFDNEEIVAALSYKSGRNWTLPELNLTLNNPSGGAGTGLLQQGESIYVTYVLEDTTGKTPYNMPCQKYAKISNENVGSKDVSFTINNVDELPYMRKFEGGGYDGKGFTADKFKVLYQIVSGDSRPASDAWKEVDFTSDYLTINVNEGIDPNKLESQLPESNNQKLTQVINGTATTYVINDKLDVANNNEADRLQFGDERFFYGNIRTHIGATVYKTVFDVKINGNEYIHTTNPTRTIDEALDAPEIRVSEIGIYDSDKSLVFIGKLSEPLKLINGNSISIEMSMDF
jgi:hypothetical protein